MLFRSRKEVISDSLLQKAAKDMGLEKTTIRQGRKGAYAIWYDTKRAPRDIVEQLTLQATRVDKTQ